MISILIPSYNYDVSNLLDELNVLLDEQNNLYEIIILDDASPKPLQIEKLKNTTLLRTETNLGRLKARRYLAEKSNYKWLLFLDADVLHKNKGFIKTYFEAIKTNYDAFFGGFSYYNNLPEKEFRLRYFYGKEKEQVDASIRNSNPYKVIISANFLIKKEVFLSLNFNLTNGYGLDNYFGALLKENQIKVKHLNNEVYHLGLEKSGHYLEKKEAAAKTLLEFYKNNPNIKHDNDLLKWFSKLNQLKLTFLGSLFYKLFGNILKTQLTSNKPSVLILQLYRLSYMCFTFRN
jgi:hypothetical protein